MSPSDYEISTRKIKALTQNISLIAILNEINGTKTYVIKGTTGNTYKVIINENISSCTCDDFIFRHMCCKHIYHVLMRVLNVDPDSYNTDLIQNNSNITSKLVFEDITNNTFRFVNIFDKHNIMINILNHIEKNYGVEAKHNVGTFNSIEEAEDTFKKSSFAGIYLIKVNDNLVDMYLRVITNVNNGWIFNNYVEKVLYNNKIARFIIIDE
ncbi:SWIM zinc finger protein [Indivirus ILV1]|uniref:SWIM zinc finger protein n=1 Tax=Indivirus ILV1 TaxID=1977633 RepID=A0A1V0SDU2_9VIRU|nr:SWIM zinc finger protein [Indivirus ILV1]